VDSKNLNIKLLNLMGNGMRYLYTTKPVESLDDLKGLKIRVMPSAVDTEVWNTLGANATTVAFSEVYSALQTHMVDGAENTFSSYAASKHNEVAPYVTLTGHQWLVTELWASDQALQSLPEEYVSAIYEAAKETASYSLEHQLEVDDEYKKQLEENGTTFITVDIAPWRDKITPLHEGIAKDLNCTDILKRINELR
jgi:TRAP-type C4-dicarboxylate transport system substrate-binding protein